MSNADEVARQLAEMQRIDVGLIGVYGGHEDGLALIDVDGVRLSCPMVGAYRPNPGRRMRLLRVGALTLVLGPERQDSPVGVVTAAGSPRCEVEFPPGSGVSQMMGYPSNVVPEAGQLVLIDWDTDGTITEVVTATPAYEPPAPPVPPDPGVHREKFTAIDSGTFQGGWKFNNQVWASASTAGAWFYGSKIADTIPDDAVIESAQLYAPALSLQGDPPILRVHTSPEKPGGTVAFVGDPHPLTASRSGWVDVPIAFIDYLKTTPGGLGFDHGGFNKYKAVGADAESGALLVTYRA